MQWFVNALCTLFELIFNNVLSPILTEILTIYVNYYTNVIWILLADVLLGLFIAVCTLVDFIGNIFNVFSGISPVYYQPPGAASAKTLSLLDVLFEMEGITVAFWVITLFSMCLCVIFTIFMTAKSVSDMTLENKNPISKVLGDAMKAGVTFLLIPFLCVMMLQLSTVITKQADAAFSAANGGSASIGTILFLSASLEADVETTKGKNISDGMIEYKDENRKAPSFDDSVRKPYLNFNGTEQLDQNLGELRKDYRNFEQVKKDFHSENFSYLSGFASAIVVFIILLIAIITCVRRIFELLLLYLVSPFFTSTIPLDDGITFARWRELFIAKFFSGFGMIFSMKFYLMVVPFLANSKLELYPKSLPGGSIVNMVLQIFLIIGGAWAVFKSQSLILEILNPEAARSERESGALLTGAVMGTVSMVAGIATGGTSMAATAAMAAGAAGSAVGSSILGGAQNDSAASSKKDEGQAYRG